jgi:hypothetical protein
MAKTIYTLLGFYKSHNILINPQGIVIPIVPFKHLEVSEYLGKNCFFQIEDNSKFKTVLNIILVDV